MAYDSKSEGRRAYQLKVCEKAGLISDLREQVEFILLPAVVLGGRKKPPLKYIADFVYKREGVEIVEDHKGQLSGPAWNLFRVKQHMMKAILGIEVVIHCETEIQQTNLKRKKRGSSNYSKRPKSGKACKA